MPAPNLIVFWKTNHLRTRTEIHFCWYVIDTLMHHPEIKHQAPDSRLPGLLLQMAFYQCTRVHFMFLGELIGLHGVISYSTRESGPPLWIVLGCVTY